MPRTRAAVLSVLLGAVLFGTAGTAQSLGPVSTTPIGVGTVRLLVGGLGLLLVLPALGHRRTEVLALVRHPWVLASVVGTAAYQLSFFGAVATGGVALGTLVAVGSAPVFAGLMGWATGHRPTAAWAAATVICLGGLVLLSADGLAADGNPAGVLLALTAGAAVAGYTVAVKRALDGGASPPPVLAASFLGGGVVLLPVLVTEPLGWLATAPGLALALYLGLATMTVANVLHARGLARLAPGPVATLMLVEPLVATVLGVAVLGERLSGWAVVGLLLVLGGLLLLGVSVTRRLRTSVPIAHQRSTPGR